MNEGNGMPDVQRSCVNNAIVRPIEQFLGTLFRLRIITSSPYVGLTFHLGSFGRCCQYAEVSKYGLL